MIMIPFELSNVIYVFPTGYIREHVRELFTQDFIKEYKSWVLNLVSLNDDEEMGVVWYGHEADFSCIHSDEIEKDPKRKIYIGISSEELGTIL